MSNVPLPANPFIYGRPARGAEFLGRQAELRTLFNRLRNGESTAVVGEPHIGKSSLLLQLARPATLQQYLGESAGQYLLVSWDLHNISHDYTPRQFWQEALEPAAPLLAAVPRGPALLQRAADTGYNRLALEAVFNALGDEAGRRLVLLLDEFESLITHANFKDAAFFAGLRSLSTRTSGLTLVTASRLSVAQMNERGRGLLDTGSPFFNNMIEVRLRPFDAGETEQLLGRAQPAFTLELRRFVRRVAGGHPFLQQALAAALMEAGADLNGQAERAAESFYDRISYHFDDLWDSLDDRTRTAAVILCLLELGGRALGERFAFGEIERVAAFGPELKKLAERGLAERADAGWQFDWDHLLLWQGERWTAGAQAFVWWVRDVAIAETRPMAPYADWLNDKRYRLLLTEQQWQTLRGAVSGLPAWAVHGVGGLARALFDELLKRRP